MNLRLRALILAFIIIISGASISFSASYKTVNDRGAELCDSISFLASQIIASNKHSLQVKLTKAERTYDTDNGTVVSPYTLNRVWAKDSTVVTGCAVKKKKFEPEHLITNDPKIFFAGGIHTGDTLDALEEFIGASVLEAVELCEDKDSGWGLEMNEKGGIITWDSAADNADSIVFYFNDKKLITHIEFFSNRSYMPLSENTQMFVMDKLRELKIFRR